MAKASSNGFMHWKMILFFCDCVTADRCGKTDLPVALIEAEADCLGIYADRHWREVQIKDTSFGKIDLKKIHFLCVCRNRMIP